MQLTLVVPDLLRPAGAQDAEVRPPALEILLARGRRSDLAALGMEAWLCQAFEVERQRDWPVAPLTAALDGLDPAPGYWLRCDPVHFRVERAQLRIVDATCFPLAADEARALVAALNAHFGTDGLSFFAPQPARWYVKLDCASGPATHALPDVAGRDVDPHLPGGDGSLYWHRALNEIQMLLHDHPVNQAREARGEPAINSVWPWGGGVKPRVAGRPFSRVWSDDPLALALATASGASALPLPATAAVLPGDEGDRGLAVLPQLRAAARYGDAERWRAALDALERDWFAPLLDALRKRRLAGLALVAPGAESCPRYEIEGGDLWKFWRRARPLASHA